MNRTSILVGAFLLLIFSVEAQTKRLDLQQSLGQKPSLTKSIDRVLGWADAQHYITYDARTKQRYQVHVKSGERNTYTPPPTSDVEVYMKTTISLNANALTRRGR